MICKKCGNSFPDDAKICPVCGEAIANEQEQNTVPTPEIQTQLENEQIELFNTESTQQLGSAPMPAQPKKKKAGLIIGIIAASLALIIALCGAAYALVPQVRDFVRRTFSSEEKYFQYVVDRNTEGDVSDIAKALNTLKNAQSTSGKTSGCMSVEFDYDELNSVVQKIAGGSIPEYFKQVDKIKLDFENKIDGKKSDISLKAFLKDNALVSANIFADDKNVVIQIPELSEEYLYISIHELEERLGVENTAIDLSCNLPDAEKLEKLVMRYINIAVSGIDGVEKSTDTLEVGDVSEKCTKLTVKLDEKAILKIAKSVLEEAKNDGELKSLVKALYESVGEDFAASDFEDAIEEALDSLKEVETGDSYAELSLYVNGKSDIIGWTFSIPEEDVQFSFSAPKKGKNTACLLKLKSDEETFEVKFTGTEEKNTVNGTAKFSYNGTSYIKLDIENFCTDADKDKNTTFTFSLDDGIKKSLSALGMPSEYSDIINGMSIAYNVKLDKKGEKGEVAFSVNLNGASLAKMSYAAEGKVDNSVKVEIPDITNAYNAAKEEDLMKYGSTIDTKALLSKITEAIPPELFELFGALVNRSDNPGKNPSYGSDYQYGSNSAFNY